jgi:hypothetical protein
MFVGMEEWLTKANVSFVKLKEELLEQCSIKEVMEE